MSDPVESNGPPPTQDRTVMLILAYLWPLALVPLVTHNPDPEIQWHAKHGLVLLVVELAALVAWSVILGLAYVMTGGLFGCVMSVQIIVSPLVTVLIVAFHIFLIIRALQGERVLVPCVSDYASRF
jgi:hypothetical protein